MASWYRYFFKNVLFPHPKNHHFIILKLLGFTKKKRGAGVGGQRGKNKSDKHEHIEGSTEVGRWRGNTWEGKRKNYGKAPNSSQALGIWRLTECRFRRESSGASKKDSRPPLSTDEKVLAVMGTPSWNSICTGPSRRPRHLRLADTPAPFITFCFVLFCLIVWRSLKD